MSRFPSTACIVLLLLACLPLAVQADNEGLDDLNQATETRLGARTIADMSKVIGLLESALEKGLDEGNTAYAESLMNSTLVFRGTGIAKLIFARPVPDPRWPQLRALALADLERALKLNAEQPEALYYVARLNLLPGGNTERATQAIGQAVKLADGEKQPKLKSQVLTLQASIEKDDAKKLSALDEAVRLAPDEAAAWRSRGLLRAGMKQNEKALADLDKSLELAPDHAATLGVKAAVLVELKRYDEALVVLDRLSELTPDSVHPLMQKARIHALRDNSQAALHELNRVLSAHPDHVAALLLRAVVYDQQNEPQKAMADLDTLLKLQPGFAPAIRMRAMLLAGEKKYGEAIEQLEKLIVKGSEDVMAQLQLAMLYMADKKPQKAIEVYTAVLEEHPGEIAALRGRGDAQLNLGRHPEAVADYERATKVDPQDAGVLNNLAWVLSTSPNDKVRNGKRAIELATKACELTDNQQAHILSTLGAAYAETGDFQAAIKWVKKGLAVVDGDEEKQALEKELKRYQAKKPCRELLANGEPVDLDKQEPKQKPDKPAEDKPIQKKPAEKQPAKEKPAEKQPAKEKPAEKQPAKEKPAEKQPAKETPNDSESA